LGSGWDGSRFCEFSVPCASARNAGHLEPVPRRPRSVHLEFDDLFHLDRCPPPPPTPRAVAGARYRPLPRRTLSDLAGRTPLLFRPRCRARQVVSFERSLGILVEPDLQRTIVDHPALVDLFNWVYVWAHWPVILIWVVWMWIRHRDAYPVYRNAVLLS